MPAEQQLGDLWAMIERKLDEKLESHYLRVVDEIIAKGKQVDTNSVTGEDRELDTNAAAEYSGSSPYTIRQYCKRHELIARRLPYGAGGRGKLIVKQSDIDRLINEGKLQGRRKRAR
ncbi:MAG: hypothetical protein JNM18_22805 [Planctomycetaceae bacterium]|nr:hypothetical protein [Planctomycetaceae bacterium]